MNNTANFVNKLTAEDKASSIVGFFDEIMVLYNLVGSREDLVICADNDTDVATFRIITDSEEAAKALYETLNASSFTAYNDLYNINMILSGATVVTTVITRAAS